jgi:hypothetical protein
VRWAEVVVWPSLELSCGICSGHEMQRQLPKYLITELGNHGGRHIRLEASWNPTSCCEFTNSIGTSEAAAL